MTSRWPHGVALSIVLLLASLSGCRRERASAEICAAILDRIVDVELDEQGFRDAALVARKKLEMRRLLEGDLRRCTGRKLKTNALSCVRGAHTTEEISHVCLR
jgi:hypothetical protein